MIKPFNQIHLKILALLSAIALWFIVITVENTVYKFPDKIDVEIRNLSKNLNLEEAVSTTTVYLRVDKEDLKNVTKSDLEVYIDLTNVEAGEHSFKIQASSKNSQAQVLKAEPGEITLKLSPIIEKEVEIKVVVEGSPAEDYFVAQTNSELDSVTISGTKSVLDEISFVEAKLILDGTQREDIKQNVVPQIPKEVDIAANLISITPEELIVTAEITSEIQQKELKVNPIFNNEGDKTAFIDRIIIEPANIILQGKSDDLERIDSINTKAIEVSSLVRNRSVTVDLNLPTGITMVNPQTIKISFKSTDLGTEPTI